MALAVMACSSKRESEAAQARTSDILPAGVAIAAAPAKATMSGATLLSSGARACPPDRQGRHRLWGDRGLPGPPSTTLLSTTLARSGSIATTARRVRPTTGGAVRISDDIGHVHEQARRIARGTWLALLARVPSRDHDVLVELFRGRPTLVRELLACSGIEAPAGTAELATADLSQVVPTEYRADATFAFRDERDVVTGAVIVEVQRQIDRAKHRTWPVYVTNLAARLDCPVMLLVFTPDPAVAAWARHPLETGHPGFRLTPIVVAFDDVPRIVELAAAHEAPELAVLSALAHRDLAVAIAATVAVSQLAEDKAKLYFDIVHAALSPNVRRELEALMIKNYEYQSEFAKRYLAQGREEGREEGREQARRDTVIQLAKLRIGEISVADELRILDANVERLDVLFEVLARAGDAVDARAALKRWLGADA
jgi:hypothetical protein